MQSPGIKIYQYRIQKGWTQAELAVQIGIAQANLSNIEQGKRDLTVSTLIRIARTLQVKPSQLLDEEPCRDAFKLSRQRIEQLAAAIVDPGVRLPNELQELAALFRLVHVADSRKGRKKIEYAWAQLKEQFSSDDIRGVLQRVRDAEQRVYASKTN